MLLPVVARFGQSEVEVPHPGDRLMLDALVSEVDWASQKFEELCQRLRPVSIERTLASQLLQAGLASKWKALQALVSVKRRFSEMLQLLS